MNTFTRNSLAIASLATVISLVGFTHNARAQFGGHSNSNYGKNSPWKSSPVRPLQTTPRPGTVVIGNIGGPIRYPVKPTFPLKPTYPNKAKVDVGAIASGMAGLINGLSNRPDPYVHYPHPEIVPIYVKPRPVYVTPPVVISRPPVTSYNPPPQFSFTYPNTVAPTYPTTPPPQLATPSAPPLAKTVPSNSSMPKLQITAPQNKKPFLNKFSVATSQDVKDAQSAVGQQALAKLDLLKNALPPTPEVSMLIEAAKTAVNEGRSLDASWMEQLKKAVKDSKTPFNSSEANKLVKLIPGLVEASKTLVAAAAAASGLDATGCTIPTGQVPVIVLPGFPAGSVVLLPGGALMAGTGGQGNTQVVTADAASILGLPLGSGSAIANANPDVCNRPTNGILLRNPAENNASVSYLIDSKWNYTLSADYTQQLDDATEHQVQFSRGPGAGEASYQLAEGTYAFGPKDSGWDLFRESFSVTIDNSASVDEFSYVVDNESVTIPAGSIRTHSSNFPIVVRFNRGDAGNEALKRVASAAEHFSVAVNPGDGLWDLYPAGSVPISAPSKASSLVAETTLSAPEQPKQEGRLITALMNAGAKL